MRENWEIRKLGDICKLYQPKTISNKEFVEDGEYPVYGSNGIIGQYNQYNHAEREILISCRGTCGRVNVSRPYSWINGNAMVVHITQPDIGFDFLKYQLMGADMSEAITGATIPQITRQSLTPIRIVIPPIQQQEKIVAELDCLTGIIEKKKQQLEELDKLAQSIFYDMFGGCLHNVPLSHYAKSLHSGKSLAGEEECCNKVLKTGAVSYDYFRGEDTKNLPADYIPLPEHQVQPKDILVSRMNTLELVGATAYVWNVADKIYLPDRLWKVDLRDNANPVFIWKALIQPQAKEYIRKNAGGTSGSMKNISKPVFLRTPVPLVDLTTQAVFAKKIEAIEKQKDLMKRSIVETETLFKSRMDYWFN